MNRNVRFANDLFLSPRLCSSTSWLRTSNVSEIVVTHIVS